jgi:hypothetical protein
MVPMRLVPSLDPNSADPVVRSGVVVVVVVVTRVV